MNSTSYTVMAISEYNDTDHMDRIENDGDVWNMTMSEAVELRDAYRAYGYPNIVAVRRTVRGDNDIRFAVI